MQRCSVLVRLALSFCCRRPGWRRVVGSAGGCGALPEPACAADSPALPAAPVTRLLLGWGARRGSQETPVIRKRLSARHRWVSSDSARCKEIVRMVGSGLCCCRALPVNRGLRDERSYRGGRLSGIPWFTPFSPFRGGGSFPGISRVSVRIKVTATRVATTSLSR